MLVLDAHDVRTLFPMQIAVPAMRAAMIAFSGGDVRQPPRTVIGNDAEGRFGLMPAHVLRGECAGFGAKVVVVKHDNARRGLPSHVGLVLVFDPETGRPAAALDAATITEIRTAAVSAVATEVLAPPTASVLAILGSGAQARAHVEAITHVRSLRRVRVWGRAPERVRQLCAWAGGLLGVPVEPAETPEDAVANAHIVCTTTASREPLLGTDAVRTGAHINAVGACQPGARELTTDLVARCSIFVDSRESVLRDADELRIPIREGRLTEDAIAAEIGQILLGERPGRTRTDETTLYKSVGLAAQDVFSAQIVARRAREQRVGQRVEL